MFNPSENEALDQWFQRLNAPLKRLPPQERAELHQEVRQHLESLVAANEELGSSPQEAWELAMTQFGDPARIGRRLAWESGGGWPGNRAAWARLGQPGHGCRVVRAGGACRHRLCPDLLHRPGDDGFPTVR